MTAPAAQTRATALGGVYTDCRLCGSRLIFQRKAAGHADDMERGVCAECHDRPEAKRFGIVPSQAPRPTSTPVAQPTTIPVRQAPQPTAPRAFTAAEKALVRSLAQLPVAQLLEILNGRAAADPRHVPFTLEQIRRERELVAQTSAGDGDWASLRKVIARARHSGLLPAITLQLVDDFAVVYQLSPAQHMRLRDVIRNAQEDR